MPFQNHFQNIGIRIILICVVALSATLKINGQNCSNVNNAIDLRDCLDAAIPLPGQTIVITITSNIDLDPLISTNDLPLTVRSGVILQGNYDLLTIPDGTKLTSTYRYSWCDANCNCGQNIPSFCTSNCPGGASCQPEKLFLFVLEPGAVIQNLRIQGGMLNLQEFNHDDLLCGGIYIQNIPGNSNPATISNCEIYGFSYAGIFGDAGTNAAIERSFIHHVKGTGGSSQHTSSKGYGTWIQGLSGGDRTYTINSTIFDDCKAAIDGQGNPTSWYINDCTFSQFFIEDNINKHNINGTIEHDCVTGFGSCFYSSIHADCNMASCNSHLGKFCIDDIGGGDTHIMNCIFHRKYDPTSPMSHINLTYPLINQNGDYDIQISGNTFATARQLPNFYSNNYGGYARISNNYIESCPWAGDQHLIWENQDNYFDYSPGKVVNTSSPQPPISFPTLINNSGTTTPDISNTNGVAYFHTGVTPEVQISPGSLGPDNLLYVVRFNPNNGAAEGTHNTSANNYFFDEQEITAPSTTSVQVSCSGCNNSQIGLYGVDVLAVDGITGSDYNSSAWTYKPYIIADETSDNYTLVFNIKDSYQEIYDGTTPPTGVHKQVELNGHRIWFEDIAEGGDGWERIEIDFGGLDPDGIPIFNYLLTNGNRNTLTFSIVMTVSINTADVRGLLVWVDDVYLKKYNKADNLIFDGGVEFCEDNGLSSSPSGNCQWYQPAGSAVSFSGCTSIGRISASNPVEDYYPDGSPMVFTSSNPTTQADNTMKERRSGNHAIVLKLPALDPATCSTYILPPNQSNVISAAIDFDYTDLLGCDNYQNAPFLFATFPSAPNTYVNQRFIIDQNISLTGDMILQGCGVVVKTSNGVYTPYSITVPSGKTLTITEDSFGNKSSIFACDKMWQGIIVEPGGKLILGPGTQISDAIDAVYCNASGNAVTAIQIRGTVNDPIVFDQNLTAVNLQEGTFAYNSNNGNYMSRCKFLTTSGFLQREPHTGELVPQQVLLNNVTDIQIGEPSAPDPNLFSDAIYGIYSIGSDLTAVRNTFTQMKSGDAHCWACGAGIFMENSLSSAKSANLGSQDPDHLNEFTDSPFGFVSAGKIATNITYNQFSQLSRSGIYMRGNSDEGITINQNNFNNVNNGIKITEGPKCQIQISENNFDNSNFSYVDNSSFYNTAITLQHSSPFIKSPIVNVWNNTITDFRIGLHAINIPNAGIGLDPAAAITGNIIHFTTPEVIDFHEGIWLQNCPDARVVGNAISNNTDIPFNPLFRGIDIEYSLNGRINCNTITNIPRSMNFRDDCSGTLLRANVMSGYTEAVNLDMATLPNQFQVNDQTQDWEPLDNVWNDPLLITGAVTDRVTGSTSGLAFNWLYQNMGGVFDPLDNGTTSPIIFAVPDVAGSVFCNDYTDRQSREQRFSAIVADSLQFEEFQTENTYIAKSNAFTSIVSDTTLLFQGNSLDIQYQEFYNNMAQSNIGNFTDINALANDSLQLPFATSINAAIADTNSIEFYKKTINEIFLQTLALGFPLNATDTIVVNNVSQLSLQTAGDAIFTAISMLGLEKHPVELSLRKGALHSPSSEYQLNRMVTLYPNPTSQGFLLKNNSEDITILEVYSNEGSLICRFTQPLPIGYSVADLMAGIYLVKITYKTGEIKPMKLIVIK